MDMTNNESRYITIKKYILSLIQESFGATKIFGQAPIDSTYSAPIYRLPVEVLSEIFACLTEDSKYWRPRGPPIAHTSQGKTLVPSTSLDPVILAQVCMLWRAVVLSTPTLWSSITIYCTRKQPTIPLLEVWLERSGEVPLNIVFYESIDGFEGRRVNDYEPTSNPFSSDVMTLLMAHSRRWKAVDFSFSRRISDALLELQPGSLPMLETAALVSRHTMNLPFGKLPPLETVWNAFHSSPKLTRGCWEINYLESNLDKIEWSRLTSIEVTMAIASLLKVLPHLENLVDLHFIDPSSCINTRLIPASANRDEPPRFEETVVLPHLRNLRLWTAKPADELFDKLTLPSLVSVHVEQRRVWQYRPNPAVFTRLLSRSQCNLKEYTYDISGDPIAEDILLDILSSQTMSNIKSLTVQLTVTDKLTRFLTCTTDNEMILPQLERLSFLDYKNPTTGLLVMAQSRFYRRPRVNGLAVLRYLQVVWRWEQFLKLDEEGFKNLAKQGMLLKL